MRFLHVLTVLCLIVNNLLQYTSATCISTSFKNIKMRVCNPQLCVEQEITGCVDNEKVFPDSTTLTINEKFSKLRMGAINNLPKLEDIIIAYKGVRGLNTYCLQNLPKLKTFTVQANDIEEIPWGIFTGMGLEFLNLETNRISEIDNFAFGDMPNLKTLVLTQNRIRFVNKMWFFNTTSIEKLYLGHNLISIVWFNTFENFPHLKHLELQFNKIHEVRYQAFNKLTHLDFLDLTNNELFGILDDMFNTEEYPNASISELRIGLNNITFIPKQFFEKIKIGKIVLHPNPWHCDCLYDITTASSKGLLSTEDPKDDVYSFWNTSYPVCAFPNEESTSCHYDFKEENDKTLVEYFKRIKYKNFIKHTYDPKEKCPKEEYF